MFCVAEHSFIFHNALETETVMRRVCFTEISNTSTTCGLITHLCMACSTPLLKSKNVRLLLATRAATVRISDNKKSSKTNSTPGTASPKKYTTGSNYNQDTDDIHTYRHLSKVDELDTANRILKRKVVSSSDTALSNPLVTFPCHLIARSVRTHFRPNSREWHRIPTIAAGFEAVKLARCHRVYILGCISRNV